MAESEEELKSLLMKVKEESEKVGLKFCIQKTEIMASSLITSWEIDGETMETVRDFILGAPKSLQMVTAGMELKDLLLLRSKRFLISWLQLPSAVILELRKIKSATVSTVSPSICYEVMGPDAVILVFW